MDISEFRGARGPAAVDLEAGGEPAGVTVDRGRGTIWVNVSGVCVFRLSGANVTEVEAVGTLGLDGLPARDAEG